ncbi:DUF5719 family protein [Rathayibacter sp. YIM 133350]|uniref:DUF5719 family protein n=1 Tax=Rathayibacter sp. YIM 133350 TaxID=3131992 RepID=UPI00307E7590
MRKRTALLVARIAGALLAIAIALVAVATAAWAPLPTATARPVAATVAPVPTVAERVCPGPLLSVGEEAESATAVSSIGEADIVAAGADADPDEQPLASPDDRNGDANGAGVVLTIPADEGSDAPPLLAGVQSQVADDETHSGLAVAGCTEAGPDSWLVGGSTDVGRTTLVVLSNPSTVSATVDLGVWGENGPVAAPGATGILVQPRSQRVISLAGLAPDLLAPVVHVEAHGGEIAAALQQSIVRGLEPGGVDIVGPAPAPATVVTIGGVVVPAATDGAATDTDAAPTDEQPGLRLLAPGSQAADATVSVIGEGDAPGTSFSVHLEPGVATDAPLAGLAAGVYAVRIDSQQPIVAAARTAVAGGVAGRDVAWFTAAPPLGDDPVMIAVASANQPTFHAWNQRATDATLTLTPQSGTPVTVTVPAAAAVAVPLTGSGGYTVSDAEGVVATVSYGGADAVASVPVLAGSALASPIVVYTR